MTDQAFVLLLCPKCAVECDAEPCDFVHKFSPTFWRCQDCGKKWRYSSLRLVEMDQAWREENREDAEFKPMDPRDDGGEI